LEFSPSALYPLISHSLATFKSRLKSHLFSSAYITPSHSYASASELALYKYPIDIGTTAPPKACNPDEELMTWYC